MYKWKYDAVIYRQADGKVLCNRKFDDEKAAERFVEGIITQYLDKDYPPTGMVNKVYVDC